MEEFHHAYLLVGDRVSGEAFFHDFLDQRGIKLTNSSDFFVYKETLFGINEARTLSVQVSRKAFTQRKIFLISPERISTEAQNALLKTFEDPTSDTHFFLVVREEALILPTLRSRMQVLRLATWRFDRQVAVEPPELEASQFLSLSLKDRLAFAKKFVDQEKNLSVFLDQLLLLVRTGKSSTGALEKIYSVRRHSDDRAVSARLILEHLALVL